MQTINILVVDDHSLFRRGLIALLKQESSFSVIAEASDSDEAIRAAKQYQPNIILLDNHLPGVNGIDAIDALLEVSADSKIMILTVSEDQQDMEKALKNGARGYILKNVEGDLLIKSIYKLSHGESVVSEEMAGKLIAAFQATQQLKDAEHNATGANSTNPLDSLSEREIDVLKQLANGKSNKEIARIFDIAEATVKIHVQRILRKLNLNSRVQAAVFYTNL